MAATLAVEHEYAGFGGGWTDVTGDLTDQTIRVLRGFMSNEPDDLVAAPAVFTYGLNNSATNATSTRSYYSLDSAGVRAGWALGIRVRFRVTANSVTRTRFIGFIQRIAPTAGLFEDQTVSVIAASWLKLASTTLISGLATQVSKRGDQLAASLVSLATFAPPATSYGTGTETYFYALYDLDSTRSTIVDGFDSVAKSGIDRFWEKADGTLVYESRRFREAGATDALVLTDVAPAGHPCLALTALPSAARSLDQIYNATSVSVHAPRTDATATFVYLMSGRGTGIHVDPGQTVVIQAEYYDISQPAGSKKIGAFNMVDDGAGHLQLSDYVFDSIPDTQLNSQYGVQANFTVGAVFDGNKATLTITNNGTVTGWLEQITLRGQGIYDYQTLTGGATVTSSQSAVGQKHLTLDCQYQSDPAFAQNAAAYLAVLCAPSLTQLDQGVQLQLPAGQDVDIDTCLALEISSAIGITETMTGLVAGSYWINAIQEEWDERNNLTLTWQLAHRDPTSYWVLGVAGKSEIGVTTTLGI